MQRLSWSSFRSKGAVEDCILPRICIYKLSSWPTVPEHFIEKAFSIKTTFRDELSSLSIDAFSKADDPIPLVTGYQACSTSLAAVTVGRSSGKQSWEFVPSNCCCRDGSPRERVEEPMPYFFFFFFFILIEKTSMYNFGM